MTFEPRSLGPLDASLFFDLFQKVSSSILHFEILEEKGKDCVGLFGREFPFEDLARGCSMGVL